MRRLLAPWGMVAVVLVASAGNAFAEEDEGGAVHGRQLRATTVNQIEAGVEAQVLDDTVAFVQLDVYQVDSDALVWTSGRVRGSAVVWPVAGGDNQAFRFSIKGWDRQDNLVTHQVTTKNLAPIADITFDNIPDDTKLFAAGEIDLDADVIVHGVRTSGSTLRVEANNHSNSYDAIEIEMAGAADGAQAIEVQRTGSDGVNAAINANGEAWFKDSARTLPDFLPICFGFVNTNGTIGGGSGNFSVSLEGGGDPYYAVDCPGDFSISGNTAVVTVTDVANPYIVTTGTSSNRAAVVIRNLAGTRVQQDFWFVIYANPSTEAPAAFDPDDVVN